MSNKSGVSNQVISLPQGGGALSGLGETFSPDLHTGTGNFAVPINLPSGRNGFQPELELVYSTGAGNGPFGLGWRLSLPEISRKTAKGIPVYDDAQDVFILSGAEDLVPVAHDPAKTHYRPRTEGLFARIIHHHTAGHDYWEVRSRDGLVSFYGTPGAAGEDPAVIADPADRRKIFTWKLAETQDPFGNRILYDYSRDAGAAGPRRWDQLYPDRIRYIDYADEAGQETFLAAVLFDYGRPDQTRPDPFSIYRAGFEVRTRRLCHRIAVRTRPAPEELARQYGRDVNDPDLPDHLPGRTYTFNYHNDALNGVSLLRRIRVGGRDVAANATQELPPLDFGYTHFEPGARNFVTVAGQLPATSLGASDLELADLFGNGLPDLIQLNGTARYWRNLGGGRFDRPRTMTAAPAGLTLADPGVQLLDANGDGRIDLLATGKGPAGYYPLNFQGAWDRRSFQRYRRAPSFNLADPEVRLVDLDGDGVTDAVRSGTRFEYFFNDPAEGWSDARLVERADIESFPNVNFSDPRVRWADMTGDGLQDIVLVHAGRVAYWPNLGHGRWGARVEMRNNPDLPVGHDPARILMGDVDGDGLADIVYVDNRRVTLWINRSGNDWSEPIVIKGTPAVSDLDAARLVDLMGTGVRGLLWSGGGRTAGQMFFLDFTGGRKPYLLDEMNNNMGALTRVGYAPSTHFYRQDAPDPTTRWPAPLPFPVQVVARVEIIDRISGGKLTHAYRYHHGYWDGQEREFRGFGLVEQTDAESFAVYHRPGLHGEAVPFTGLETEDHFSPPTLTKTWFHQGPVHRRSGQGVEAERRDDYWPGDPSFLRQTEGLNAFLRSLPTRQARRDALRALRGRALRTELYALDDSGRADRPYTVTEQSYGLREETPPADDEPERRRIFFPHRLARRTTQWERGDDPMTRFELSQDYDRYGQARRQIQIACPRGWRPTAESRSRDYLTTLSELTFAQRDDGQRYIVDRTATTTSYEIPPPGDEALTLAELEAAIREGRAARRLIGQTLTFYDGAAFTGLPAGQLGDFGAPVRTETLALTEAILRQAYDEIPPYLEPDGPPAWTDDYPPAFRERAPALAGYKFHPGDGLRQGGYFTSVSRRQYDVHLADNNELPGRPRGLVTATLDPLAGRIDIQADPYQLLPVQVTDPAGLTRRAAYDYRVLRPRRVTGPNGNRRRFTYSPLGLLAAQANLGKEAETVGDTPEVPGTRFVYDLSAFGQNEQPISVRAIRRRHHLNEPNTPPAERDETIETVEYSDGFGRLIQTRSQAATVRFGDKSFGGGLLPADQNDQAGTAAPVAGESNADETRPNVVVSGWQTYNNKGWMVETYEPFFGRGWAYLSRAEAQAPPAEDGVNLFGRKTTRIYDPRGRVVRTVNPDGSEQRVIYGVPTDLADPAQFTPTPWETYIYDANDNAGRTHDGGDPTHQNTPTSRVVDALGRPVETVKRNGPDPAGDWFTTRSSYDIRGNLLAATDPLGRVVSRYTYDLTPPGDEDDGEKEGEGPPPLRIEHMDAGLRQVVRDAAGNQIERRDGKGAVVLQSYDALRRPVRLWARDNPAAALTLRERLIYGDSPEADLPEAEARARNLRGRSYRRYDEAGLLVFERYDFKGNLLEKMRQVIADETILSTFPGPDESRPDDFPIFRVNWQPPPETELADYATGLLAPDEYRTSTTYDALNRVKTKQYPQDVAGNRRLLRPDYNRAGQLQRLLLDDQTFVDHIAYNARGRRTLIAFGPPPAGSDGLMTRYAYDPHSFRLVRLRTEAYRRPAETAFTFRPTASRSPLQDTGYAYDLAGNLVRSQERAPGSGIKDNPDAAAVADPQLKALVAAGEALVRRFSYDPLYRLTSATGRECRDIPHPRPWTDDPRCGFGSGQPGTPDQANAPQLTGLYQETYTYDPAGNLTSLAHTQNEAGWTRRFGVGGLSPARWREAWPTHLDGEPWPAPPGNRLTHAGGDPTTPQTHVYDANGNLTRETSSRHFSWDHSDRLAAFRVQAGQSEPSVYVHYLYDSGGQRVKKLVRRQGGRVESTAYIDGRFEAHRWQENGRIKQNSRLHLMDGEKRIALLRVGPAHPQDQGPAVQYHLGDHLGSSSLVVDEQGGFVNREEYTPYGETSFGGFGRKRYRFTGRERDEESGLYYHGARYYAPWIARWVSCDPAGAADGFNLYGYARHNPLRMVDPQGTQSQEANESAISGKDVCNAGHHASPTGDPPESGSAEISGDLAEAPLANIAGWFQAIRKSPAEKLRELVQEYAEETNNTKLLKRLDRASKEIKAAKEAQKIVDRLAEMWRGNTGRAQTRVGAGASLGVGALLTGLKIVVAKEKADALLQRDKALADLIEGVQELGIEPYPVLHRRQLSTGGWEGKTYRGVRISLKFIYPQDTETRIEARQQLKQHYQEEIDKLNRWIENAKPAQNTANAKDFREDLQRVQDILDNEIRRLQGGGEVSPGGRLVSWALKNPTYF